MSEEPLLRPEEVQGVLAGNGDGAAGPTGSETGPRPYSLREPLAIPPAAEAEARKRLEALTSILSAALGHGTDADLALELDCLQQQRTAAALSVIPTPAWVVALSRTAGGGIALALPARLALALVELGLGGTGRVPETGREPTRVESRLLERRLASAAAGLGKELGTSLDPEALTVDRVPPEVAAPGETVAVGLLRIRFGEGDHTALLLVTASMLVRSDPGPRPGGGRPGPLAARLERIPVEARPVLRAGRVSMSELMAAESGNVLKLDAGEDSTFELRIGGRPRFHGRIVRKDDRLPVFSVSRRLGRDGRREE